MADWNIMRLRKRDWQALSVWLLTIVLLSGGFAVYSYFYVEHRERYFTERKLRELRLSGDRLKLRIENIANNVLPNAVNGADDLSVGCPAKTPDRSLKVFETDGPSAMAPRTATLEETCRFLAVAQKTQLVPDFKLEKIVEYRRMAGPNAKVPSADPASRLAIRTEGDAANFLFTYQTTQPGPDGLAPKWRARIELPGLLGRDDIATFDQLLVTDGRGEVQFQIGSTRIAFNSLASLVDRPARTAKPPKTGEDNDSSSSPNWNSIKDSASVVRVVIAGEDYLLFLQPVRISLLGSESADQLSATNFLDWRVVGLVARDRFSRDSSTFSYTMIVIFLFALLLIVFAEPLIKVLSLGSTDPLRKRDVVSLAVSFSLMTALSTLFALDMIEYAKLEQQLDSRLQKLSIDVNAGFNKDLDALLGLLQSVSEKEVPPPEDRAIVGLLDKPHPEQLKAAENDCPGAPDTPRKIENSERYPNPEGVKQAFLKGAFFQRMVWIDPCGNQRRKWTIDNNSTPLIPVGERPYFQRARNGQLWRKSVAGKELCFWLGPVESRNTGENLATLSVRGPATVKEDSQSDASCPVHWDQSDHWVVSVDATLPSLRDVVLPPGFGFLVVDKAGRVLFHSDSVRHLRENFFEESDQNPAVRASVFGGGTEFIDARYLGTDHRFLSSALEAPPWTLLVFYDKHFLRTANVEILSTALVLFLIFLGLQVPALVILWFRDTRWLWPNKTSSEAYPPYLLGVLGQLLTLTVAILFLSPVSAAYAAFLVPSVTLVATYFHFGAKKLGISFLDGVLSTGPLLITGLGLFICCLLEKRYFDLAMVSLATTLFTFFIFSDRIRGRLKGVEKLPSAHACYLLKIGFLLLLMGFLPAVAAFRVAYENEIVLLLKHEQYRFEKSLDERKIRLRKQAIKISGQAGETFFEKRMEKEMSRDVYAEFFFRCPASEEFAIASNPYRSPLGGAVKKIRLYMLFDPWAVEDQGLLHGVPDDLSPSWLAGHPSCLFLTPSAAELARPNSDLFRSRAVKIPDWRRPGSYMWFAVLILFLFGLAKGVTAAAGFLAKRIFLLDLAVPLNAEQPPEVSVFAGIWRSCNTEEKIALYDVAEDGFLNSKNKSIPGLLQRGLLALSPLRLGSEKFRDVIQTEGANDKSLAPENQEEPSLWRMVKWPLLAALLGAAVFLFFNQRTIFEGGVGFIGAMAAAVTTFFNLFDQLRGGKR
jgi:hypothetical protein